MSKDDVWAGRRGDPDSVTHLGHGLGLALWARHLPAVSQVGQALPSRTGAADQIKRVYTTGRC